MQWKNSDPVKSIDRPLRKLYTCSFYSTDIKPKKNEKYIMKKKKNLHGTMKY